MILKMDLTKTENGSPSKWVNNPAVNKKDKVQLMKDTDGSAYLKAENYIHYYYAQLFPVNETDSIIVTVKARGSGVIETGLYIFATDGRLEGQVGRRNFL